MENRRKKDKKIGDTRRGYMDVEATSSPEGKKKTEWRKLSMKSYKKISQN